MYSERVYEHVDVYMCKQLGMALFRCRDALDLLGSIAPTSHSQQLTVLCLISLKYSLLMNQ